MRITKVLLIGFAVVATPGLLSSGWIAWTSWQGLQRARSAEAVTEALRTSMQAQTLLAEETADLNAAALIRRADARMQRQAANLTNQRIEAAIESAATAGLALPDRGLIATLDALRQRVAASATGSGAPDTALSEAVLRTRREAIANLERTSAEADHRLRELQPAVVPLAQAAWQIMRARDEAGQRALIVYLPMLNPDARIPPERLREYMQRTGLMTHALASARHAAGDSGDYVAEAFRSLDDGFLSMDEPRFENYAAALQARIGGTNAPWPDLDLEYMHDWATRALSAMTPLRDILLDEAVAQAQTRAEAAQTRMLGAAALVAFALLFAAGGFIAVLRRVVVPMRGLTASVTSIAGGDLAVEVPYRRRRNELGAMAGAIEVLRTGSIERNEMAAAAAAEQAARSARGQRLEALLKEFEAETAGVLRSVAAAATELDATAATMADTAEDGAARAASVAAASEQASRQCQHPSPPPPSSSAPPSSR